jgi:hypothetical protein
MKTKAMRSMGSLSGLRRFSLGTKCVLINPTNISEKAKRAIVALVIQR